MNEKQIEKLMKSLDISREEAIQLIEDDKAIDRGAKMFDLDPELEKGAKKARQAERKASAPVKREKKAKPEKAGICLAMMKGLEGLGVEDFTINNPEREFLFMLDGTKYKVTLACPRS
jgi:hypothetical protein